MLSVRPVVGGHLRRLTGLELELIILFINDIECTLYTEVECAPSQVIRLLATPELYNAVVSNCIALLHTSGT